MARKGWNALSADYRGRLERAGISRKDYEAGASIKGARGHANTPERPTQAKAYPNYRNARSQLEKKLIDRKFQYFGTSPKYNPRRSMKQLKDNPPSMAQLRFWASLTYQEWLDEIRDNPAAAAYLGYH